MLMTVNLGVNKLDLMIHRPCKFHQFSTLESKSHDFECDDLWPMLCMGPRARSRGAQDADHLATAPGHFRTAELSLEFQQCLFVHIAHNLFAEIFRYWWAQWNFNSADGFKGFISFRFFLGNRTLSLSVLLNISWALKKNSRAFTWISATAVGPFCAQNLSTKVLIYWWGQWKFNWQGWFQR